MIGLGVAVLIDDLTHGRNGSLMTPIGCLSVVGLILALLIGFMISEFRKWYPTRSARLQIFQEGFVYQQNDRVQVCSWRDIRDITHRNVWVHSKYATPRKVSVIRSVIKTDGTVISLAETLDLHKLTTLIAAGKKSVTSGPRSTH